MKKVSAFKVIALSCVTVMFAFATSGCGAGTQETATPQSTANDSPKDKNPHNLKASINVWTWETQQNEQKIIDDFNKEFPGIQVSFTNVASKDMVTKLQTAMASGSDLPDVAWMEISQRGKLLDLDIWEDLAKAPYNVNKADILDFELPLSTTKDGKLAGIEVSPPFAGLAYKRDLAKKYFGTDDPAELEKLIKSWDDFVDKGKLVKEQSGGKVFMLAGANDAIAMLKSQNKAPYIKDNKLNLNEVAKPIFTRILQMKQAGILDKVEGWSADWYATYTDKNHIFYPAATWSPTYVIKPNDKAGSGNWGIMNAPGGGYLNGGTIVGIPKDSKNKDAAFAFIQWLYLSQNGAKSNLEHLGYFSPFKNVYKDPQFYSQADPYFGGQDVLAKFASIANNVIIPPPVTKYDKEINDSFSLAVKTIDSNNGGQLSEDELITKMMKDITSQVPEIK